MKPAVLPAGHQIAAKFLPKKGLNNVPNQILNGWLHKKPKKFGKALTFASVRDPTGRIFQVVDRNRPSLFASLKPDSTVSIEVQLEGDDLECKALRVLGEANLIPGELGAESTKDWPAQYRYIQLRQPGFQHTLRTRAKIVAECRKVLDSYGFTEVETPILFKSTPEGAREFLVPTRRPGLTYALPQSPQQYKQLLIASGIDRYYQVAKCFRDEDLRADRQPEFTQLDIEMGFVTAEDVQEVIAEIVRAVWVLTDRHLTTIPEAQNDLIPIGDFKRLTYDDCIANYGIDKPDLRSSLKLQTLHKIVSKGHPKFPVLEFLKSSRTVDLRNFTNRVTVLKYVSETQLKETLAELSDFDDTDWPNIVSQFGDLSEGDTIYFGDRQILSYENPTPLGRVRQQIAAQEAEEKVAEADITSEKLESVAVWVEKFPSFEPIEVSVNSAGYPEYDHAQLKATHHPFTMVNLEDYHYLESGDFLRCHGMHFDLVIDGVEVGGGSQRIHDSSLQRFVLQQIVGVENPDRIFGHLLGALETGTPPHAGFAIGLDRMVAMALGFTSIRDVIAFPKTMTGTDPVVSSPSRATPQQLAEYYLKKI